MKKIALSMIVAIFALQACDGGPLATGTLKDDGPDEFAIIPNKPLELPEELGTELAQLPTPTPGARSRAIPAPRREAVATLGGQPERLDDRRVTASESQLIAAASVSGVNPNIRSILAAEQADNPDTKPRLLERAFGLQRRANAGRLTALDPQAEAVRLQRLGVRVIVPPELR